MWNLKKSSLLEGRSTVLATKGESGVWLDVGKAAEPRGDGGVCERLTLYLCTLYMHITVLYIVIYTVLSTYCGFLKQMTKELLSKSIQCCPGYILLPSDLGWRASISAK